MTFAIHTHDPSPRPVPASDPFAFGALAALKFPYTDAVVVSYAPGQEVVGEGDPTENYFVVVRGVFRAVKVTRDGRRQIFAFYMAGDLCGLEPEESHGLTIEAVNAGAMATLSRQACHARMNRDPQFNAAVFENVTRALTHAVDHTTMVGRSSAEERLAWFLSMLSARGGGRHSASIELTMQRQDIRLSRPHHRNRQPNVHPFEGAGPHRSADDAPHRHPQARSPDAPGLGRPRRADPRLPRRLLKTPPGRRAEF